MSKLGTSTYKETLKQYAFGVAQDVKSSLADFIAPRVPVGVGSGQFKIFNDKDAFQIYDTRRAVGGPATRIEFDADDGTFNCEANALETPIDDTERERAGENDSALEEARTRTLVINATLAREKRVFDLIKSKVSAAATWNHAGTDDPIEIIEDWLTIGEDGYLNLRFSIQRSNPSVAHGIALVKISAGSGDYVFELRHNANGDGYGNFYDGVVAFDLNEFRPSDGSPINVKIKWKGYERQKEDFIKVTFRKR